MFKGGMSRRAKKPSKEEKAAPVGIRYKSIDTEGNVRAGTLSAGSGATAAKEIRPEPVKNIVPQPEIKKDITQVKKEDVALPKTVETSKEDKKVDSPISDSRNVPGPKESSKSAAPEEIGKSIDPEQINKAVDPEQISKSVDPEVSKSADPEISQSADPEVNRSADPDISEITVCDVDDLKDGEMREFDVGEGQALLVKDQGEFYAIGAKCTHYAAPLVKGVLCNGHVRCPWHGACFNFKTGDIEDFPGLDSVPKFDVSVSDGKVKILADPKVLKNHKREKPMVRCSADEDSSVTVIVGGGPAGLVCAETLRQENYKGRIVMISKDHYLPYDRPLLSKKMDVKPEHVTLRKEEFFQASDIEIQLGSEVTAVDTVMGSVTLDDGETVKYDKLLLATGTVARHLLSTPGHDLDNIRTLRTLDDAAFIAEQAQGKCVVIIGTSFIGVETAAFLAGKAKSVTIVDLVEAPFQLALGKEVGAGIKTLLEENGIQFYFKNSAKEFIGENGKLTQVLLQDDTLLDADFCVVGIGVVPATDFLKSSAVALTDRGFVSVDKHMATGQPNVYAAGDITHFPLFMAGDDKVNIQHWQMAHQQGRIAALNILNKDEDIRSVPFFWTMLFGKSLRYTGYGFGYDDIIMHGNPEELKFIAYYTKGEQVIAVASMNEDPKAAEVAEIFLSGSPLTKDMVR